MKKNSTIFFLFSIAFFSLFSTAQALTIHINAEGAVTVYESVLGEKDEERQEKEKEEKKEREEKKETRSEEKPVSTVRPQSNTQTNIELKTESSSKTKVELKRERSEENSTLIEERSADKVEIEFPAEAKELRELRQASEQEKKRIEQNATLTEQERAQLLKQEEQRLEKVLKEKEKEMEKEQRAAEKELEKLNKEQDRLNENDDDSDDIGEEESEQLERRRKAEQRLRMIKIEDEQDGDGLQFVLESSDGAKMKLRGAQFAVNADTGTVTIKTPSGDEILLNTLPDEVVQKMALRQLNLPAQPEVEVKVNDDGTLQHVVNNATETKLFLGLLPRTIPGTAVVDDITGEVEFEARPSFLDRILSPFLR